MSMTTWRILFVDDDQEICDQISSYLDGVTLSDTEDVLYVETCTSYSDGLSWIESRKYDLVILDVRMSEREDDTDGRTLLEDIKNRKFVPVIFYTGLPAQVVDAESAFVRLVEKTHGVEVLQEEVERFLKSELTQINRALSHHIDTVQRKYLWDFVAENYSSLTNIESIELAYLLARRLAMSLARDNINNFASLISSKKQMNSTDQAHPNEFYIIPPITDLPSSGDIYVDRISDPESYWILLTPACDFAQNNVSKVLLARCNLVETNPDYKKWKGNQEKYANNFQNLIGNKKERHHFLPATGSAQAKAFSIPNLVVDFQDLSSIEFSKLEQFDRLASLDSPFSEELKYRFTRYFGRIGTPDLDPGIVQANLLSP